MLRLLIVLLLSLLTSLAGAASANDSPQDLLRELYRVHDEGQGPLLQPAASAERRRFFTAALSTAFDQELNRSNSDEVGNLDFDPFFNAQDMEISGLDFAVAKVSGTRTTVIAQFSNYTEQVEIVYHLIQEKSGWYIDDVDYGDHTRLRQILQGQ